MEQIQGLMARFEQRTASVGVIGLGYVGLPLALAYASQGFKTYGYDVDFEKIATLRAGRSFIDHIESADVERRVAEMTFVPVTDFECLRACDAIIICVPTPLTETRDPDLSYVRSTVQQIRRVLRRGQLVVLESTTYPGTTDDEVRRTLEETGLRAGQDFYVAFSPEREDPGNTQHRTTTIPKVVGGCDDNAGDLAQCLYAQAIRSVVRVSNAATAEAVKITENVFRAVNIALVNELKVVYERMGVDIWEVLDAAATKPFGFMRFNPGPGWGGHCIPLDPFYLSWKAREYNVDTKFIELAGEINRAMPDYVVERLLLALNQRGKPLKGSAITLLGLAYKKDVGDTRESPAFPIAKRLLALGAKLSFHDPYIAKVPETRSWPGHPDLPFLELSPQAIAREDAFVIVTDHTNVDYDSLLQHAPLIVDARGVFRRRHDNVVRA